MFLKLNTSPMLSFKHFAALLTLLLALNSRIFTQNQIEWIIPPDSFSQITHWGDHYLVLKNRQWGILDKDLRTVVEPRFTDLKILNDWALGAKENGKWGFLHRSDLREWAIEPRYEDKGSWSNLMTDISQNRANAPAWTGYLDEKPWTVTAGKNGVTVSESSEQPEIDMVPGQAPPKPPRKGPILTPRPWHKKWKSVSFMTDPYSESLADTLLVVRNDVFMIEESLWHFGLADSSGNILLPPRYSWILKVNLNTFSVPVDTGKAVAPAFGLFRLPDCKRMSKGVYWQVHAAGPGNDKPIIVSPLHMSQSAKRCGLLSPAGEEMIPCEYQDFRENTPPNFIPAKKNNLWGLIDMQNHVLLPFEYDAIWTASARADTDVFVAKNGKTGVLRVNERK
jgi:hypothetical protein